MKPILLLFAVSGLSALLLILLFLCFSRKNPSGPRRSCPDPEEKECRADVQTACEEKPAPASGSGEGVRPRSERRMDDTLAEVYSRIENYFQTAKPYLEGNVSICEVAQRLYTNKQYVSVAVKRFSGLNFCQYVNRYRIRYAMELFRGNRTLRMSELAQLSGFNSVTSFNISFRYFMDQPPGDWCRKCRNGEFDEMTL